MSSSSQKFITRNRAPRVQIEYDVELYGSEKKVQLPFVMGVMSDLAGKSKVAQPSIEDRSFLEIDVDNFDDRMRAMAPRAAFSVPNTLTGEGNIAIDLTFEKMDDFSPAAIAAKVDGLRPLLEARTQLSDLMAYMDGKAGAETLIEKILADPALLSAVSNTSVATADQNAALESLRAAMPEETIEADQTGDVLAGLAAQEGPDQAPEDTAAAALAGLRDAAPVDDAPDTSTQDALANLAANAPEPEIVKDTTGSTLASLATTETPEKAEDNTDSLLADLAAQEPETVVEDDQITDALNSLGDVEIPETVEDTTDSLLADLAADAPEAEDISDDTADALSSLGDVEIPETVEDTTDDLLADLAADAPEAEVIQDDTADALSSLSDVDLPDEVDDSTDDLLADLAATVPETTEVKDDTADALTSLDNVDLPKEIEDTTDNLLADLAAEIPPIAEDSDNTGDILSDLSEIETPTEVEESTDDLLADLATDTPDNPELTDDTADILSDLGDVDVPEQIADTTDELLADLAADLPEPDTEVDDASAALDSLAEVELPKEAATDDDDTDLDDLLGDLGGDDTDLDDLLGDTDTTDDATDDLDDLLGDLGGDDTDLDDLLGDTDTTDDATDDLDDLLGDLGGDDTDLDDLLGDSDTTDDATDDLDDLLGDLGGDDTDLDDLLSDSDTTDDLDDLLGDLGTDDMATDSTAQGVEMSDEPEFAYGQMSAERPEPAKLNRKRFRLAILGDFSGRAARGQLEIGDALAARKAILLDPDTAEDVIESFAADLVLPIGKDGAGVAVKLGGLDDLHPDELYENVELFGELNSLRGQLSSGATAEHAAKQLRDWGEKHGQHVAPTKSQSSGNTVPADLKLSDFQKLIGDTEVRISQPSPIDELMARIVGPHIRAIPNADAMAMKGAVDQALSAAMRLVLHHPEFQSIEAQWRSIDLIARSIETDNTLDVMLYDVSAEEIAADLASADDLSQSGFARLLTEEPMDEEFGRGGYSALIGLYTFEETPPHAELLGRIGRVAAHVDAPFISAITPTFLETAKDDRHKLVAEAWDTLRAMPEAGHLGLVTPRFMLRHPYGAKSEPIYEFEFEEFTMAEGLKGMLWANPAVLVAILLAKSFKENGASMSLGSIMALGDIPFHFVNDQYGDQVALPCTERNITLDKIEMAVTRGFMSVAGIKGRDEIRLTSFGSLAGGEILGPWTGAPPPKPSPPTPEPVSKPTEEVDSDEETGDDIDLDDLLAGFSDDTDDGDDIDDTDAELAALLGDL